MKWNKKSILEIDRKHIWHPFTQMKDFEKRDHGVIVKGRGTKIYDIDGNAYYDTISSWWTNTLGHCNPRINRVLRKQLKILEHVNFSGFTHPFATGLVEEMIKILPSSLSRYFFSDNGSTAVEVAVKMAFQYWQNWGNTQKKRFVMLKNAYHGDTIGAVSVGGVDEYHKLYKPLMFESLAAEAPDCSSCSHRKGEFTFDARNTGCSLECFSSLEKVLSDHRDSVAAVIVEPLLMGAGGMKVYPPQYLKRLRKLTEKLDVLLIFDEVATGFGRTGTLFALEQAEVTPDLICLSKGLTAGYMPLSLTVTTERIFEAFYDDYNRGKTFFHGHSYTANPLACVVAIESLKILKKQNLPYSQKSVLEFFHGKLREFGRFDFIADIRYLGFIGALDLMRSRKRNQFFAPQERIGQKVYQKSLKNGLVLRPLGDMIYFFLPLIVKKREVREILERTEKVLIETMTKADL